MGREENGTTQRTYFQVNIELPSCLFYAIKQNGFERKNDYIAIKK